MPAKNATPPAPAAPKKQAAPKAAVPQLHLDLEQFLDHLGLVHFKGKEFTPYWSRYRGKVQNSCPPEALWHKIIPTLVVLDAIREALNAPIELLSTYRSPAYNAAVGGEAGSFHMRFMAVDFTADCGARELHRLAKSMRGRLFKLPGNLGNFRYAGGIGLYVGSNFVHIDCRGTDANWTG